MNEQKRIDETLEQIKASRDTWRRVADGHRKEAYEADRMAEELQKAIEYSTFGGKTYSAYISSLEGQKFESDGVQVKVSYYTLIAEEEVGGATLIYEANVHASESNHGYTIKYPPTDRAPYGTERRVCGSDIPKKYRPIFEKLKAATDKLKVVKP